MQNYVRNENFIIIYRLTNNKKVYVMLIGVTQTLPIVRGHKNEEEEVHF